MLYKFRSKAAGDVIMTSPVGDKVLRAMGREPATQGIFEVSAMSSLLAALERSIAEDDARTGGSGNETREADAAPSRELSLRQRAWPLIEMMRKSLESDADIVWGG
jgi:Domain of unknown function (DUF1840)